MDLLAAAVVTVRPLRAAVGQSNLDGGMLRLLMSVLPRLVGLVGRALVTPLIAVVAPLLVLLPGPYRAIGDAVGWSTDDQSRKDVQDYVEGKIRRRVKAGPIVMVGHSQGGSILASIEPAIRRVRPDVRLVTMGTGHGLLAAADRLLPRWPWWRSGALWSAVVLCGLVALLELLVFIPSAIGAMANSALSAIQWGGAVWTADLSPQISTNLGQDSAHSSLLGVELASRQDPSTAFRGSLMGIFALMCLFVTKALVGERAAELTHVVRTGALGIDIVASHDLVAASLLELGESSRLRPVRQCGSLVADHVTYFDNGCSVLPLIAEQIALAGGLDAPSGEYDTQRSSAYLASGVRQRRWTHPWIVVIGAPLLAALIIGPPTDAWSAGAAALAVCLVAAATVLRKIKRLRCASEAASASTEHVWALEEARRRRKNLFWTLWLALVALPLFGGGVMTATLLENDAQLAGLTGPENQSGAAGFIGTLVLCAAWFSLFGSYRADACATALCVLGAVVWPRQATTMGDLGTVLLSGTGFLGLLRLVRHRPPRPRARPPRRGTRPRSIRRR